MSKAGLIMSFLYWYKGLLGWTPLGPTVLKIPANTRISLAVGWLNTGDENLVGNLGLTVTKPNGTGVALPAVVNQDEVVSPGGARTVQFEPIVLDQVGTYNATVVLSQVTVGGGFPVLDEATFPFALVSTKLEMSELMNLLVTVMIVTMMLKMAAGATSTMWPETRGLIK